MDLSPELEKDVKAVILTYDAKLSVRRMIRACTHAKEVEDKFLIATNMDYNFPGENRKLLVPCAGAFVKFVCSAVGRQPCVLGKPEKRFFEDCITSVQPDITPERCVMIGDCLTSDIEFANRNNFKYSIFVETGVHNMRDLENFVANGDDDRVPTHCVESTTKLFELLREIQNPK